MSLEYKSTRVPLNSPTVSDYLNIISDCCCTPSYIEFFGYKSRVYIGNRRASFKYCYYDDEIYGSYCIEKWTVYTFEKAIDIEYNNQIIGIATELTYCNLGYGYIDAVFKRNDESFINKSYNLSIVENELLILNDK